MTEDEIIQTWKSIDRMSRKIIPPFLDRESIVSKVLLHLLPENEKPPLLFIKRRLLDAFRKETKYNRETGTSRREIFLDNDLLDKLTAVSERDMVEEREELDRLMGLVCWTPTEVSLLNSVFYNGMSLNDAGKKASMTLGQSLYAWLGVKAKLLEIRTLEEGEENA